MGAIESFDDNSLQAICDVVANTSSGLTGSEISKLLSRQNIADPDPMITKRHRLFAALQQKQRKDGCSNNVLAFLESVMDPVRYVGNLELLEQRRTSLNTVLALKGFEIGKDGKVARVDRVRTLPEAQRKANDLRSKLIERKVHSEVLRFCQAELLVDNYFHAVFEATKSIADRVREITNLSSDGAELVDKAFGLKKPILAINSLRTETEQMEQAGFGMLLKGIFGTFRNVTAHAPKIKWQIPEEDALDLLTLASFVHRRLDKAVRIDGLN